MNRYICLGLLAVIILVPAGARRSAIGATYYVVPKGDDANPGTEAQPWATLRKAAASVQPGDTVRIKAGDYFESSGWNVTRAGTAEKPITYQAYGDGEVRITPSSVVPAGAWTHVKGAIYSAQVRRRPAYVFQNAYPLHPPGDRGKIYAVDDMIPNSFYTDGTTLYIWLQDGSDPSQSVMRAASAHVVELRDCHYTVFDGLTVEYGYNGFKDQGKATHHVTYRNCTIRSIGSQGIQPVPQDSVIERNLFQKIGSNKYLHGIYNSKPGLIVRHNVFEEIAGAAIHQYQEGSPAGGHCEFYGNIFRKSRPMTLRPDATGRSPYYVEIIAWGEGNNRIYNNVFYGEGKRGGISLNSINNRVYHNTFVGSAYGIEFHAGKTGNQVTNNIFQDAMTAFGVPKRDGWRLGGPFLIWPAKALPQTLDYNLYFNAAAPPRWQRDGAAYQAFSAYQQAAGEIHSRYENPRLTGDTDAHPRPGSPAIDVGIALDDVAVDADGAARPQGGAWDIGAYEAKPAAPSPP
jgi:parallel beta-helix repeat protein